jgi:allophanate hydrolase subunit 1
MRLRAVGADALLLEVDDPAAWFAELTRRRAAGELTVVDIVPGARTVLLDGLADTTLAAEAVRTWTPAPPSESTGAAVDIAVTFDGPDLLAVAELWHTSPAGVVGVSSRRRCTWRSAGSRPAGPTCPASPRN